MNLWAADMGMNRLNIATAQRKWATKHGWSMSVHNELLDLGFEDKGSCDYRKLITFDSVVGNLYAWIWAPRQNVEPHGKWQADLRDQTGFVLFDDPLTAARWLLVEAANR